MSPLLCYHQRKSPAPATDLSAGSPALLGSWLLGRLVGNLEIQELPRRPLPARF